jgi:hypothetical protein
VRLAPIALAILLLSSAVGYVEAQPRSATLTSSTSGLSIEIADPDTLAIFGNISAVGVSPWSEVSPAIGEDVTHRITVETTDDQGVRIDLYDYAPSVAGQHTALLLNVDHTHGLADQDVIGALQPYLDDLARLEGEVTFARVLQMMAGISLAILVAALFAIGMREERRQRAAR